MKIQELIAIAAATTTTAAFTTATAVPATTTAAARALFAGLGNVDCEGSSIDFLAIQGGNRGLRFIWCAHGDETKTTGTAAHAVHHQVGFHDSAMLRKRILEVVFGRVEGKIPYEQFVTHVVMSLD